jgi:hypothetical protein
MNRLSRIQRVYRTSVTVAIRQVRDEWVEVHTRPLPKSIEAAFKRTGKVSAALDQAFKAGATDAQIHAAMDEGTAIANRRGTRWLARQKQ